MIGSVWKMDPRLTAVARHRTRIRSIATVHAVATVKIDRGPQCKNTKPGCNRKIQSQTRAVNGIAALVTTPLRLLVTRAPSGQASQAPGDGLSHGLLSNDWSRPSGRNTCPLGSTGAAGRSPVLGTRVGGSRCRDGHGMWTQGTAMRYLYTENYRDRLRSSQPT